MYEQSLDRLACAVGGRAVLPPAFQVSFVIGSVRGCSLMSAVHTFDDGKL